VTSQIRRPRQTRAKRVRELARLHRQLVEVYEEEAEVLEEEEAGDT
jgi:hypothetical protein